MKTLDSRIELDKNLLSSLIGNKIAKIKHDMFFWGNFSTQKISIYANEKIYQLQLIENDVDFIRGDESVSSFKFVECEEAETNTIYTGNNAPKQVETIIDEKVTDIIVIEDKIIAFEEDEQFGEYQYVEGLLIVLENKKYCFWKENYYSEDIMIDKGQNPEDKIVNVNEMWSDWAPKCHSQNERTFVSLVKGK